jgi:hypothetical protein
MVGRDTFSQVGSLYCKPPFWLARMGQPGAAIGPRSSLEAAGLLSKVTLADGARDGCTSRLTSSLLQAGLVPVDFPGSRRGCGVFGVFL